MEQLGLKHRLDVVVRNHWLAVVVEGEGAVEVAGVGWRWLGQKHRLEVAVEVDVAELERLEGGRHRVLEGGLEKAAEVHTQLRS